MSLAEHAASLTPSQAGMLTDLYPSGTAMLWGATPGVSGSNTKAWGRVAPGDFVFFTGEGRLFAGGTVTCTFRNATLASELWGVDDRTGLTWELMFGLDELRSFDLPYEAMNRVVGYAPNNIVQGFTVLGEERSAALYDFLGLDSDAHPPVVPDGDFLAAVEFDGETERLVSRAQRLEQTALRRALLRGAGTAACALCGRVLPSQFLIAAHIKQRAACEADERRDIANVAMLACSFGCDALYEAGYLAVDPGGQILLSPALLALDEEIGILSRLEGRRCTAHTAASSPYFEWHRRNTFRGLVGDPRTPRR